MRNVFTSLLYLGTLWNVWSDPRSGRLMREWKLPVSLIHEAGWLAPEAGLAGLYNRKFVISGYRPVVDEIYNLLCYYTAHIDDSLPTFRENLGPEMLVRNYHRCNFLPLREIEKKPPAV